jgi:hypothetical protein
MRAIPSVLVENKVKPKTLARDVAKAFSGKALRRLVETLDQRDEVLVVSADKQVVVSVDRGPSSAAQATAKWILEWTEGKAAQQLEVSGQVDHVHMHLDALRELARPVLNVTPQPIDLIK